MKKFILLILTAIISFGYINESRAVDSYTYDDDGKLLSVNMGGGFVFTRDENGKINGASSCAGYTSCYFDRDSNGFTITSPGSMAAVSFDNNENLIISGTKMGRAVWTGKVYSYTYDGTKKVSRSTLSCSYNSNISQCQNNATDSYTYVYDDYGNIVTEKIGNTIIATHSYSENYLENQKCSATKSCTSCAGSKVLQEKACVSTCGASFKLNDGECDRVRYTPAEAAKWLKDDDNTITITFKK